MVKMKARPIRQYMDLFDRNGVLTDESRSWVKKQVVLALSVAAVDLGIKLADLDISVGRVNGSALSYDKSPVSYYYDWSHYQNRLEIMIINRNSCKIPAEIFEKIVDRAKIRYGFAVSPRFSKFTVSLSQFPSFHIRP